MDDSYGEIAVVGTLYSVLTCGTVLFGYRLVRVIQLKGRADRRTLWRLAAIRTITALNALSGAIYVGLCSAFLLISLWDLFPSVLMADPGTIALVIYVPLMFLSIGVQSLLWLATADELKAVKRSSYCVRWGRIRIKRIWSRIGGRRAIAAIRRLDRPLW